MRKKYTYDCTHAIKLEIFREKGNLYNRLIIYAFSEFPHEFKFSYLLVVYWIQQPHSCHFLGILISCDISISTIHESSAIPWEISLAWKLTDKGNMLIVSYVIELIKC